MSLTTMDPNQDPASPNQSTASPKALQLYTSTKQARQAEISDDDRAAAIYMAKRATNTAIAYAIAAEKAKCMARAQIAAVRAQEAAAKAAAAWAILQSHSATSHAMPTNENETPAPSPKSQKASTGLTTGEEHEEMDLEHRQNQIEDGEHNECGEEDDEEIGDEN